MLNPNHADESSAKLDLNEFKENPQDFHIIDIRNGPELKEGKIFDQATHIPLPELFERTDEIKPDKPVVVHCASGYRSAIGASILEKSLPDTKVYDLGGAVKDYQAQKQDR